MDIKGVETAVVNTLRRLIMDEVPTMAVKDVFIFQNTTVMQDEVLAQRLGLLPIKASPGLYRFKQPGQPLDTSNTLTFALIASAGPNSFKTGNFPGERGGLTRIY